uniref:Transmembrane protein n=1 Tax=Medicago truncatula TaxID=3880 RepID=B7FFP1_MEDTR|nr:unknown [Medicago truncatula]
MPWLLTYGLEIWHEFNFPFVCVVLHIGCDYLCLLAMIIIL